jgi:8-oxo-dGDP phosphatase
MGIRTLSSRVVHENPWLSVREDGIERADGSRGIYSVIDKPDFAVVIPLEDDGFHLVEQFRYPVGARSWEFPSGSFPPGVTGDPEEMAAAELEEETGFTAGRFEKLGFVHCASGMTGEGVHVFLATGLTPGEPDRGDGAGHAAPVVPAPRRGADDGGRRHHRRPLAFRVPVVDAARADVIDRCGGSRRRLESTRDCRGESARTPVTGFHHLGDVNPLCPKVG